MVSRRFEGGDEILDVIKVACGNQRRVQNAESRWRFPSRGSVPLAFSLQPFFSFLFRDQCPCGGADRIMQNTNLQKADGTAK